MKVYGRTNSGKRAARAKLLAELNTVRLRRHEYESFKICATPRLGVEE